MSSSGAPAVAHRFLGEEGLANYFAGHSVDRRAVKRGVAGLLEHLALIDAHLVGMKATGQMPSVSSSCAQKPFGRWRNHIPQTESDNDPSSLK